MLAIIGGSGLTTLSNLDVSHREVVRTPYGEPSGAIVVGQIGGMPALFLPRHGYGHTIPPHMVNYRANIWALRENGASGIISVASVGGIRGDLSPGDIVVPHQIIDYTWGRKATFFDGGGTPVTHVDFTDPYDADLRDRIAHAAAMVGVEIKDGAVYAATQGPRLETAAEIDRLERDGAHVVGMTGMPEAILAREIGLPYAAINVVANHAAGRGSSAHGIHFESLEHVLQDAMGRVRSIIERLVGSQGAVRPLGMSV
ncbi:MAG TPA: S-methyl-5'-thioinosine phosphorylase [Rhodocyclaceae bacterium]|jgi:5'-methylthioadenosine phosphorylase|nr:S-methyl-5'-thioinosine phosphorylase [Betaproteobacteria bacterium]HMV00654.1 S-methyl-5'-thioinosine phosphorylase [Rhodocyclaceae bacterium]HMV19708.1 S-methyl-5'-thioinosine phosphorylase [Rhodocyclaceae bacterium]HMW76970.1 S-methyl-5'-thioinosine phosphorylase [Rhodocyclaceae bacterium]HNE43762.1 S-methyl-5'-thioinosine phosphorylase [Rhodocyclaceae bacterium]